VDLPKDAVVPLQSRDNLGWIGAVDPLDERSLGGRIRALQIPVEIGGDYRSVGNQRQEGESTGCELRIGDAIIARLFGDRILEAFRAETGHDPCGGGGEVLIGEKSVDRVSVPASQLDGCITDEIRPLGKVESSGHSGSHKGDDAQGRPQLLHHEAYRVMVVLIDPPLQTAIHERAY
jgi:hypothetical protein